MAEEKYFGKQDSLRISIKDDKNLAEALENLKKKLPLKSEKQEKKK